MSPQGGKLRCAILRNFAQFLRNFWIFAKMRNFAQFLRNFSRFLHIFPIFDIFAHVFPEIFLHTHVFTIVMQILDSCTFFAQFFWFMHIFFFSLGNFYGRKQSMPKICMNNVHVFCPGTWAKLTFILPSALGCRKIRHLEIFPSPFAQFH